LALGVEVSELDELIIADVSAGSPAAAAGLAPRDRLLAVNGTALATLADMAEMERHSTLNFEVVSSEGVMRAVSLRLLRHTPVSRDELTAIVLSAIALGLFLAFVAPSTNRRSTLPSTAAHIIIRTVGLGAISVLILLLPVVSVYTQAGFGVIAALYGVTTFGLSFLTILKEGNIAKRLLTLFMRLAPIPLVLCVTGVCGSTVELNKLVASQHAAPWGWHVWSSPFALAALLASLSLVWPAWSNKPKRRSWAVSVGGWLSAVPAAMILSACCLGGWLVPGVSAKELSTNGGLLALGCFVFLAKTWLVLFAARRFASVGYLERRSFSARASFGLRFCGLLLASGLAVGWTMVDLPDMILACGQVLATATFATFFTAFSVLSLKRALAAATTPLIERRQSS
jgi:hypothetical protein